MDDRDVLTEDVVVESDDAYVEVKAGGEAAETPWVVRVISRFGVVFAVVFALLALFWEKSEGTAPAGNLVDSSGQVVTLATQMAPVTLVHFWATWCPPCLDEVPAIQRLAEKHSTDHNFSLVMVAVNDDPEKVKTFLGDRFPDNLFDPDWKIAHRFGTRKLPETHLVVRGEVVESFIGATDWDAPQPRQMIADALASL